MTLKIVLASVATLTLVACGGGGEADTAAANNAMDNMSVEAMPADENAMAAAGGADAPMPANANEYATMAAASDMYEIESSKLAVEKSQNPQLREFAQMLIRDHEKSTADLKAAAQKAVPVIVVTPVLTPEQEANLAALRAASAADFDRLYISQQVPAHEKALALVRSYSQTGTDEGLKAHATAVIVPVEMHLERVRAMPM